MTDPYAGDPYAKSIADSLRGGRQPRPPKGPRSKARAWVVALFCAAATGAALALIAQAIVH